MLQKPLLKYLPALFFAALWGGHPAQAEDFSSPGGELTSDLPVPAVIQVFAPNVTDPEHQALQLSGFTPFHRFFTRSEGLGPFFINSSCAGCHINNGRGPVKFGRPRRTSTMVVKAGLRRTTADGTSLPVPGIGSQLQNHSFGKRTPDGIRMRWRVYRRRYPDGTRYRIRKPVLTVRPRPGSNRRNRPVVYSTRLTPPIIGPGLLEAVPDSVILSLADPDDESGNGIRGRPNYVRDPVSGELVIGRFGFKAAHPTVKQQTAAAFLHDMGLSNSIFSDSKGSIEITDQTLHEVAVYLMLAGVPRSRNQDAPDIISGREIFMAIGCNDCHVMTLTTGDHAFAELSNQVIHPYTDLLLHNMGKGLADRYREFSALGREWRTTPLWGLGLAEEFLGRRPLYLHDGRARTLEEAIIWHGGEALESRRKFMHLDADERDKLIEFLRSL